MTPKDNSNWWSSIEEVTGDKLLRTLRAGQKGEDGSRAGARGLGLLLPMLPCSGVEIPSNQSNQNLSLGFRVVKKVYLSR